MEIQIVETIRYIACSRKGEAGSLWISRRYIVDDTRQQYLTVRNILLGVHDSIPKRHCGRRESNLRRVKKRKELETTAETTRKRNCDVIPVV
jgi:hypothetical protein